MSDGGKPGWREDDARPGLLRYWDGQVWSPDIPPRPKPDPVWKQAWPVTLGVLVAAAIIFGFWRLAYPSPSNAECLGQAADVIRGDRLTVDPGCR